MATDDEKVGLARRSIELAKAVIVREAPFLTPAVGVLEFVPAGGPSAPFVKSAVATDGARPLVDVDRLLAMHLERRYPPVREVLHVMMHCLLGHVFPTGGPGGPGAMSAPGRARGLACDIAAARAARSVALDAGAGRTLLSSGDAEGEAARDSLLRELAAEVGERLSVRDVERAFSDGAFASHVAEFEALFAVDDHAAWAFGTGSGAPAPGDEGGGEGLAALWARVSGQVGIGPQASPWSMGRSAGGYSEAPGAYDGPTGDYRAFLRRFANPGEVARLSEDEFDANYYTFGLSLYGNLPLIEPVEFREEKRIREFAVVIDTSGSVYGEAVSRFVAETFAVLSEEGAFFEDVNLRIIQCDEQVRSDVRIASRDDLARWRAEMRLEGFGGTDFRPAFEYVNRLVAEGQFENLGGLIYFTDGWGVYPRQVPPYETAFVFYDENHREEDVPPWAIQITLKGR